MAKQFRPDIQLSGNRSGNAVLTLKGPANSYVRGGGERVFETDAQGRIIRDITPNRVKIRMEHKTPDGKVFYEMEKTGKPPSGSDKAILKTMGVLE